MFPFFLLQLGSLYSHSLLVERSITFNHALPPARPLSSTMPVFSIMCWFFLQGPAAESFIHLAIPSQWLLCASVYIVTPHCNWKMEPSEDFIWTPQPIPPSSLFLSLIFFPKNGCSLIHP